MNINLRIASSLLIAILLFAGVVMVNNFAKDFTSNQARAQKMIQPPVISALSSNRATLTFITSELTTAKLELKAPFVVEPRVLPVSNIAQTLHQITLTDLRSGEEYIYWVIVYDRENVETRSEEFSFTLP